MSIVTTMARAICGPDPDMEIDSAGNVQWMLHTDQARAALRSVKPSDISDAQLEAFREAMKLSKDYFGAEGKSEMDDRYRRAIAAAIAKGGE